MHRHDCTLAQNNHSLALSGVLQVYAELCTACVRQTDIEKRRKERAVPGEHSFIVISLINRNLFLRRITVFVQPKK